MTDLLTASVFLPSYNKPEYVVQAIQSVFDQAFEDWELWILENSDDGQTRDVITEFLSAHSAVRRADLRIHYKEIDLTAADRAWNYATAVLLNRFYPQANGKYVFYISDDDLFDPDCLDRCVSLMEAGGYSACWFGMRHAWVQSADEIEDWPEVPLTTGILEGKGIPANRVLGPGYDQVVDCRVDGGQVAHLKKCLEHMQEPWFPETMSGDTRHCDGAFLQKLVDKFVIYPVYKTLLTHRFTPHSVWTRS